MLFDQQTAWIPAICTILLVLIYLWERFFSLQGLPKSLPWAGVNGGAWSRARTIWRSFFGMRELIQDGYYKYSKNGRSFVLPNLATGHEVVIPMSQMRWLLEQPDHVLSQNEVNRQFLHADRTMLHPNIIRDYVHGNVIRREMTKGLDAYADAIVDEIEHAMIDVWGQDTNDWQEVEVYNSMLEVIGRISNRVLVGLPLCRDRDYLRCSTSFSRGVVITAGLINLLPAYLRPVLAPIVTAYDTLQFRRLASFILPIIKERSKQFRPGLDYKNPDYSQHNDYIQWALHDAYSHNDPLERTPEMIAKRLAVLSFAGIQSSVITITNALFDIASSPSSVALQDDLRDEVQKVKDQPDGQTWTKAGLARMVRIDSALRESMRLWGFISRGVMKKVVSPAGIRLPTGEHLPPGTNVGVTMYGVHHDEAAYPGALTYDAFRFSRALETLDASKVTLKAGSQASSQIVTTSETFLGFSHGRHACPGRFFAANQMKLLLAHIVLEYDIEPITERPPNPWLNNSIGPPITEKVRIRRRLPSERPISAESTLRNGPCKGVVAAPRNPMGGMAAFDAKIRRNMGDIPHLTGAGLVRVDA